VEIDPPERIPKEMSLSEIRAWLERRLTVQPAEHALWPVRGGRLAAGLPNLLFACPRCKAPETLFDAGVRLHCSRCRAEWTVTHDNRLLGSEGSLRISDVAADLRARILADGTLEPDRLAREGVVLHSSQPVTLLDVSGEESTLVGHGHLLLTPMSLELRRSGAVVWSIPLVEMQAVSVDIGRSLFIRGEERVVEAIIPRESLVKWEWITEHWRRQAQSASKATRSAG
jgi:hypothetical protein